MVLDLKGYSMRQTRTPLTPFSLRFLIENFIGFSLWTTDDIRELVIVVKNADSLTCIFRQKAVAPVLAKQGQGIPFSILGISFMV
jgi:hypothetical protein